MSLSQFGALREQEERNALLEAAGLDSTRTAVRTRGRRGMPKRTRETEERTESRKSRGKKATGGKKATDGKKSGGGKRGTGGK